MVPQPQNLPTRFPCWCRAVYSWGGESKRDLGFVEGDLIECLNAGDGSWWMGRLRRDKRMMGLFPSNFVEVLDDSFRPASRASSPMPDRAPSPNPYNPQPKEVKAKPFRKPFQAYVAPDPAAAKRAELAKQESLLKSRTSSPRSSRIQRTSSPQTMNRSYHGSASRVPSPPQQHGYGSRAPSPAPSFEYRPQSRGLSRGPSPAPYDNHEIPSSPPPPPPPAHRYVNSQTSLDMYGDHQNGYQTPVRGISPRPNSPGPSGLTPSPLRNAMDDVMSSLEDMGLSQQREADTEAEVLDPWSPEAFDQAYTSRRAFPPRSQTAMGNAKDHGHDDAYRDRELHNDAHARHQTEQKLPQLSNYVDRMESRLGHAQHRSQGSLSHNIDRRPVADDRPPPPPKSHNSGGSVRGNPPIEQKLRHRKSAFEMGRQMLGRTFTTKSSATNSSSGVRSDTTVASASTQATDRSIMSGYSAGGFSATSAGSLARKKEAEMLARGRSKSAFGHRQESFESRPQTPATGFSFHSSHASDRPRSQSQAGWHDHTPDTGILGGLTAPRAKKSGFFKKIIESAKTGAASARSSIAVGDSSRPGSSMSRSTPNGSNSIASGFGNNYNPRALKSVSNDVAFNSSPGPGVDWVQVRRDINRSNTLSRIERIERKERCQMMDHPAISPVEELYQAAEGEEGADGRPIMDPTNFQTVNLSLVDKNARFINSLPPMTNPMSLATGYICRPYRNDVQRLRAIFTWVSEKIAWEGDFEGQIDAMRVIQTKRGCAEEVAVLVMEMCNAVGIHCDVVRGYLKAPGEMLDLGIMPRANHFWNAVVVDNEWRIIDCSLASPTNPRRSLYSSTGPQMAESWWFLARPLEICWTHIPSTLEDQHICPPVSPDVLLSLPCACPPFFKNCLEMDGYDTSLLRIDDLELVQIKFNVPADTEVVAEVEAREFTRDHDGDCFESGEIIKKRALAQAEWVNGQKRYTVKALLPGDEGQGILKVYSGKRGLMHSIKDIPHPLAFAVPIVHAGDNPPYDFVTRHPTPHAQRHDLYVAQPQCARLAINNTFVFAIRQHPSSLSSSTTPDEPSRAPSPSPFHRPSSAMSMAASTTSGSNPSTYMTGVNGTYAIKKPAKLAIQAPGGKILRLMRKDERNGGGYGNTQSQGTNEGDGGTWETIIKVGERGVWRGLVLADRSARWCVFAEWNCV